MFSHTYVLRNRHILIAPGSTANGETVVDRCGVNDGGGAVGACEVPGVPGNEGPGELGIPGIPGNEDPGKLGIPDDPGKLGNWNGLFILKITTLNKTLK